MIQDGFHIGTHIWVIVFVDRKGTGCVLYEKVKQPELRKRLWKIPENLLSHKMAASALR
jgi:hypothetical protein